MSITVAYEDRETSLVLRAQAGDHAAFDRLVHRYRAALLALAFLRTSDLQAAEDLTQETLTRAWEKLPTLQVPAAFLPWLKIIAANACNSWYRRALPHPDFLSMQTDCLPMANTELLPLQAALARERQRELRQALATLPDANRLALMMHVWGGHSYEDIAAFTGVRLTTVEGRIYRAKRQLRRLLHDEGAEFLGEPLRQWQAQGAPAEKSRRKKRSMAKAKNTADAPDLTQALALTLFSQQFSALIDCGVSLVRSLLTLQELPPPYGNVAQEMRIEIENGATLSWAMSQRPLLFSTMHIGLIRAGEVGGILEETLRRSADLMTKEWKLARHAPGQEQAIFLLLPSRQPQPQDWSGFSPYQRTVTLLLFCEMFGMLLLSGVPILQAMRTVTDLLPPPQRIGMMEAQEAIKRGEKVTPALERTGIFPGFVTQMINLGEEAGSLDSVLHRASEVFEHELECRLLTG